MRVPGTIFAVFGTLFVFAAAPGLTWLDAGELGAAAHELGIAHPPGFSAFAVIHHGVMRLVPLGDAAFRGNLASALLGALALVVVYRAARAWGHSPWGAGMGAVLVGLAPHCALHAGAIEVYTGAALMAAGLLWCFGRWRAHQDRRWALGLAFIAGLAVGGHHPELRLLALPLLVAVAWRTRGRFLAALGAVAAFGGAVIVYLPVRAGTEPMRNWGDPSSFWTLWDHFTGARIRAAYADQFGHLDAAASTQFADQWVTLAPVLLILGAVGLVLMARRPGGWAFALLFALDCLYSVVLNPMGVRDLQNGLLGVVVLGIGCGAVIDLMARRPRWRAGVCAAVTLCAVLLATFDQRHDRGLPRLIDHVIDGQPPEAVAMVASDNFAAGLAFRQVVEGARPDLAVLVRQHIGYASSVEPVRRRLPEALRGWSPGATLAQLARLEDDWPVAWEWSDGLDAEARPPNLHPHFPFYARPHGGPWGYGHALERVIEALGEDGLEAPQAKRATAVLADNYGRFLLARREYALAVDAFRFATRIEPNKASRWSNLGSAFAQSGRFASAIEATRVALELAPSHRLGRLNQARYLLAEGQHAEAEEALGEVSTLGAEGYGLRGVSRGNRGDLEGAAADFEAALAIDPKNPEARAGMAKLKSGPSGR